MSVVLTITPPPWVNRDFPRALLRQTRGDHSAAHVAPSY